MARPNLRSATRQNEPQDVYDVPQSSPSKGGKEGSTRSGRTRKPTQRAQDSMQQERSVRRSRRSNVAADDRASKIVPFSSAATEQPAGLEEPPPKRRRTGRQRQEPPVNRDEVHDQAEDQDGREEEDENSRPTDDFLKNINEGIFGNVISTNRQHSNPQQEPEEESRPSHQVDTHESEPEQQPQSHYTKIKVRGKGKGKRSRDQRTLVAEPSTREVQLAPDSGNIMLPTHPKGHDQTEDARSESSGLFVSSERGEDGDDDEHEEPADEVDNQLIQEADDGESDDQAQHSEAFAREGSPELGSDMQAVDPASLEPRNDIAEYLEYHGRPGPEHKRPVVKIRADRLAYTENMVASKGWSGLKKDMRQALSRRVNGSQRRWPGRLKMIVSHNWSGGTRMLKAIAILSDILEEATAMPHSNQQTSYFSTHLDKLKTAMVGIEHSSEKLGALLVSGAKEGGRDSFTAADDVTTKFFIPLLVLTLRSSFRLGGTFGEGGVIETVSVGTFTNVGLGIVSHLMEMILKLLEDLKEARVRASEDQKTVQRLHDQLAPFQRNVDEGLRIIKERDPERLRFAKERDERAARIRQMEEQEDVEAREWRMSAFVASTQRMREAISLSASATQPPRSTPQHARISQQVSTPQHYRTPQRPLQRTFSNIVDDAEEDGSLDDDQAIAVQLQHDREEREREVARLRRIAMLKEQDRRAREMKEAEARTRKAAMEKRFQAFIASSQQMRA